MLIHKNLFREEMFSFYICKISVVIQLLNFLLQKIHRQSCGEDGKESMASIKLWNHFIFDLLVRNKKLFYYYILNWHKRHQMLKTSFVRRNVLWNVLTRSVTLHGDWLRRSETLHSDWLSHSVTLAGIGCIAPWLLPGRALCFRWSCIS